MSDTRVPHPEKDAHRAQSPDSFSDFIPHQEALAVKLTPRALLTLAVISILTVNLTAPLHLTFLIAAAATTVLIRHDYRNFLNLGRGGVPSTFRSYLSITWLRLFALADPFSPPAPDPSGTPSHGILSRRNLPRRSGPRPSVAGLIPHRQLNQRAPDAPYLSLRATVRALAGAHPQRLTAARSCFEKHGLGLFARWPANETCRGEILHVHSSDRSMHMSLHPEDIAAVLEGGWGQRHPLARRDVHVKETFVMIYAPRGMIPLIPLLFSILGVRVWGGAF